MNLEDYSNKMKIEFICGDCGSGEIQIIDDIIGKCVKCGEYIDLQEEPIVEKIIRTKPKRKYNGDEEE